MAWKADEHQRAFIERKLEELKRRKEGCADGIDDTADAISKDNCESSAPKKVRSSIKVKSEPMPEACKDNRVEEQGDEQDQKPRTSFQGVFPKTEASDEPKNDSAASSSSTASSAPQQAFGLPSSSSETIPSFTNLFKNDGSFLEHFKKMQKLKIEVRAKTDQLETTEAQRKLEEETAGEITARDRVGEARRNVIERLAITVVVNGHHAEDEAKKDTDNMKFLQDGCGNEWEFYQERLSALSAAKDRAEQSGALPMVREEVDKEARRQKRKSRWGDWGPEQSKDPSLLAYAKQVYGSTDLTADQWKQLEDQRKMRAIFEMMQAKKAHIAKLQAAGKVKYEYDSDEETDGGTWEHKRRAIEMEKTRKEAQKLTQAARGKHHMGDFLPAEELEAFIKRYDALKKGQNVDFSSTSYEENKLTEDNVGFQMLQKMGWSEGKGLGAGGAGITTPVAAQGNSEQRGLGQNKPGDLSAEDDEYEAYRKRMMLAYRFRPNPLNNPRRQYY